MSYKKTMPMIHIYSDGACHGNPGPGGAGVVMICEQFRKEFSIFLGDVTNNIAELTAIKIGLENVKRTDYPISIYTDSQYALGVLTKVYRAYKNCELIQEIQNLMAKMDNARIIKVDGHSGNKENERADYLATLAIKEKKSRIYKFS